MISEPVPQKKMTNPFALGRPKASTDMLQRQGSFRGFSKLQEASSPFKRSVSLRLGDLPSTLQRQNAVVDTSPTKSVSRANTGGRALFKNQCSQFPIPDCQNDQTPFLFVASYIHSSSGELFLSDYHCP